MKAKKVVSNAIAIILIVLLILLSLYLPFAEVNKYFPYHDAVIITHCEDFDHPKPHEFAAVYAEKCGQLTLTDMDVCQEPFSTNFGGRTKYVTGGVQWKVGSTPTDENFECHCLVDRYHVWALGSQDSEVKISIPSYTDKFLRICEHECDYDCDKICECSASEPCTCVDACLLSQGNCHSMCEDISNNSASEAEAPAPSPEGEASDDGVEASDIYSAYFQINTTRYLKMDGSDDPMVQVALQCERNPDCILNRQDIQTELPIYFGGNDEDEFQWVIQAVNKYGDVLAVDTVTHTGTKSPNVCATDEFDCLYYNGDKVTMGNIPDKGSLNTLCRLER